MRRRLMSELGDITATLIQQLDTQAGDIVFADPNSEEKRFYRLDDGNDVIPSEYVPIGVVVIPASHNVYGDFACGVMSLVEMDPDNPDTGSENRNKAYWGPQGYYLTESNYTYKEACHVGSNGNVYEDVQGTFLYVYQPSDYFDGLFNPYDTQTFYKYNKAEDSPVDPINLYYAPSPYKNNGTRNSSYYLQSAPSNQYNFLSDFGGKGNSNVLINCSTSQPNWKIDTTIDNKADAGFFPAACCCWRYHTKGTKQGEWYLPSSGELGYISSRLKQITNAILNIKEHYGFGIDFHMEHLYISSTEYSDHLCVYLCPIYGIMGGEYKDVPSYCRAFIQITTLEKNYGDILISGGNTPDIPASGGSSQVTGYTYSQTYGYGDSTTNGGVVTGDAEINVTSVSADALGTTEKERTKIGDSVLTITMNGKTASKNYEVYQEANIKTATGTSGGNISYGNVTAGSITNGWIGAGGGTGTGYAGNGSQSWSKSAITTYYSYTSGATSSAITTAAQSGTNSIAPSRSSYSVSAGSKGTTVSGVTTWSAGVTWSGSGGKSASGTIYVQQAANEITSRTWLNGTSQLNIYTSISNLSGSYTLSGSGDINANNYHEIKCFYKSSCSFTVTYRALAKATFSSGSSGQVTVTPSGINVANNSSIGVSVSGSYPTYNVSLSAIDTGKVLSNGVFYMSLSFSNSSISGYTLKIYRNKY